MPHRSFWNRLKLTNYSLSVVLLVPFILLITGTVSLVGYLSFRNGQKAVNNLSSQLRQEILARIDRELEAYFSVPHNINQLSTIAFLQGELSWNTGEGVQQFLEQLRISPYIYAVYCGNTEGDFIGATRLLDGQESLGVWIANKSTDNHLLQYRADFTGKTDIVTQDSGFYDPKLRPWYQLALKMEGSTWSEVYISFSQKLPTITASQPVYDRFGRNIIGVCATDVLLSDDLRSFLSKLNIGKTGIAFILNRKGELISTSTDDPLTTGQGKEQKLLKVTDSINPLVQETGLKLVSHFQNLNAISRSETLDFQFQGDRQLVQVLPFQDRYGLDFLIVLVLPESDFMEQIQRNNLWTGGLSALALGGAVVIGIWVSRRLSHPLKRLSHLSQTLAEGQLDQQVEVSSIRELKVLAESFNRMAHQLKTSFEALEEANTELEHRVEERTAALAQSEERWQLAIQGSHDGIWDLDPQQNEVFYSPRCKQMLGFEDWEFANTPASFRDRLHPDDHDRVMQAMEDHLNRKIPHFRVEFRMRCKDGQYKWILSRGQALWDDSGTAIRMSGSHSDIHDRKLAEANLKRRADRDNLVSQISRQLLENNLDLTIDIALENIRVFCSSQYAFLLEFDFQSSSFLITHFQADLERFPNPELMLSTQKIPISAQHLSWIYQQCYSGAVIHLDQIDNLPRAASQERETLTKLSIQSLLIVPTLYRDIIVGGMGLATVNSLRTWQDEDSQLLQLVGEFLAMALARRAAEEALLQEQEKSERLLLNVLPAPIVNRLKQSPGVIADEFESVSILFADIVGFTTLASHLEPGELVDLLNEIFSGFDQLASRLKLEKIKTIGDAYMVAAGLPTPRSDHAQAIAEMALGMQSIIENISLNTAREATRPALQIRTGINTGKVVAGVIGTHKFIYDLWGDTVNVASRMESSGEPGSIQASQAIYQILHHQYHFVERGEVHVKGKGLMKTYWLRGAQARS
jgi:PAS domain S-box-containing protein